MVSWGEKKTNAESGLSLQSQATTRAVFCLRGKLIVRKRHRCEIYLPLFIRERSFGDLKSHTPASGSRLLFYQVTTYRPLRSTGLENANVYVIVFRAFLLAGAFQNTNMPNHVVIHHNECEIMADSRGFRSHNSSSDVTITDTNRSSSITYRQSTRLVPRMGNRWSQVA